MSCGEEISPGERSEVMPVAAKTAAGRKADAAPSIAAVPPLPSAAKPHLVIKPRSGWTALNLLELWQ